MDLSKEETAAFDFLEANSNSNKLSDAHGTSTTSQSFAALQPQPSLLAASSAGNLVATSSSNFFWTPGPTESLSTFDFQTSREPSHIPVDKHHQGGASLTPTTQSLHAPPHGGMRSPQSMSLSPAPPSPRSATLTQSEPKSTPALLQGMVQAQPEAMLGSAALAALADEQSEEPPRQNQHTPPPQQHSQPSQAPGIQVGRPIMPNTQHLTALAAQPPPQVQIQPASPAVVQQPVVQQQAPTPMLVVTPVNKQQPVSVLAQQPIVIALQQQQQQPQQVLHQQVSSQQHQQQQQPVTVIAQLPPGVSVTAAPPQPMRMNAPPQQPQVVALQPNSRPTPTVQQPPPPQQQHQQQQKQPPAANALPAVPPGSMRILPATGGFQSHASHRGPPKRVNQKKKSSPAE